MLKLSHKVQYLNLRFPLAKYSKKIFLFCEFYTLTPVREFLANSLLTSLC